MNLDEFRVELKKYPMTGGFVQQIDILIERYADEYICLANDLLHAFELLDLDPVKTARKYIFDYLKQLDYFIKNKDYGHSNYDEVKTEIYDNEKVMIDTYMPGLLLSYAYTTILYEKNHLYLNSFVPKIKNGMKGIEVGFGEGFYIWEVLKNTQDTTVNGYDISPYAIKFAENFLNKEGIDKNSYKLRIGNVFEGLEEESNSMDFATLAEVIEHIPNPELGIREVSRILKSNGHLYLTTVMNSNHMDHISNFKSVDEVRMMIENEGLVIVDERIYHIPDDFPESNDVSVGMAFVAKKVVGE